MPTRIEIELTSAGADGSWTWRAAGAREPRGTLDGSILPAGAAVGDQLKVESEKDIDGIHIVSIVQPKQKSDREGLLELLPSGDFEPVIQQRATRDRHEGGRGRPRRERGERGDRDRDDRRGPRRDGEGGAPDGRNRGGPRRDGEGGERRHARPHFTPPPELPQRPKPKRLRPGKLRRSEVLAGIPEEQRPVAELALQGMAAVRQRLREDNARLKAEDKPEMPEATVLKMAENLLPQLRVADWLDRAEAAKRQLAHLDLRDLRSVVASSDDPLVVRDESTRDLAAELKVALVAKQDEELNLWLSDVEAAVEVGRVVRALRVSAMPPKAGVPFPHQLGVRLGEATTASLSPEDPADRWIAVLEAAAFSPVRTLVTPAAAPAQPAAELVATVTRLAPLLPQVAALFGVEVPEKAPTPKPLRPTTRKKDAPKDDQSRHGKTASHPGPNPDAKAGAEPPKGEGKPAKATEAAVEPAVADAASGADVVDAVAAAEPEAAAPDAAANAGVVETTEPEATETASPEAEVAATPEPAEAAAPEAEVAEPEAAEASPTPEVADAAETEAPEPEAAEAAAPEAAAAEPEAAAPEADAAEVAPDADVAEVTDIAEPEAAEAAAPEAEVSEPEAAAPEADVADAAEPTEREAPDVADAAPVPEVAGTPEPAATEAAAPEAEVADPTEPAAAEVDAPEADVADATEPDSADAEAVAPDVAEPAPIPEVAEVPATTEPGAADVAAPESEVADATEPDSAEAEAVAPVDAAEPEAADAAEPQADVAEVADAADDDAPAER